MNDDRCSVISEQDAQHKAGSAYLLVYELAGFEGSCSWDALNAQADSSTLEPQKWGRTWQAASVELSEHPHGHGGHGVDYTVIFAFKGINRIFRESESCEQIQRLLEFVYPIG